MNGERWTRSGVRLRRASQSREGWNWLFVPGGPGLGSQSVAGLARAAEVPGTAWLVDLPGEGSNRGVPQVPDRPYERWPHVLLEAVEAFDDVVMVGHSTGGMFLLALPELEARLAGLCLVSSAPHAGWRQTFSQWAEAHPIPGLGRAAKAYAQDPNDDTLRALTLAAAEWNFTPTGLAAGRALLENLPYCHAAAAWADAHFDDTYQARWKPGNGGPATLIVSGAEDHVVDQGLWQDDEASTHPRVLRRTIEGAGHFPWIENPQEVRAAFADLTALLASRRARGGYTSAP
ncbi:alpha/beta fold hydrolase [Streptomyces solincola]|uniref:alpha/beta fold hydrolase n=1 Tax=Streptomyces solincola TaxID=2100817 RepID=UPI0015E3C4E2|nr:alpha/beta fold hydrolase [Streptomyces solincola]